MLLARPQPFTGPETINDVDGMVSNFWRSVRFSPAETAEHADWPVNENDLHARHAWLVGQKESMRARLEGDPEWHDPRAAGWWAWGACGWIAGGWCSGKGPWSVVDGELVRAKAGGVGVKRQRPHLSRAGCGINRKLPHLGDRGETIMATFRELSARLRDVRVACGDWSRVVTPMVLGAHFKSWQPCGVFLDPPYGETRAKGCYAHDSTTVYRDVHAWAIANGDNPALRICVAGLAGEFADVPGWTEVSWGHGGYGKQGALGGNERLWFSPHCLIP